MISAVEVALTDRDEVLLKDVVGVFEGTLRFHGDTLVADEVIKIARYVPSRRHWRCLGDPPESGFEYVHLRPVEAWYRVDVSDGSGFASNMLRFTSREGADAYAKNLYSRWTAMREWRVVLEECDRDAVWDAHPDYRDCLRLKFDHER